MEQKIKELRSKGLSLREIGEVLKIDRSLVEKALAGTSVKVEKKAVPAETTSEKKAATKKTPAKRK